MFGRGLSGEVVLTMGLSSRSMCSSLSVAIVFLCVGGRGGEVSMGWGWLGGLGFGGGLLVLLDGVVFVVLGFVVVFAGGQVLFLLVVGELFWVGCVCGVEG